MAKNEEKMNSFDVAIKIAQMDKYMAAVKKDEKNGLKKAAIASSALIPTIILDLIFHNPLILIIGGGLTIAINIVIQAKDFIKGFKSAIPKNDTAQNITNIAKEEDVEQILQKGIEKKAGKDFYTEEYKNYLEEKENYDKLLQEKQNNSSKLRIVPNNDDSSNKDKTYVQSVQEDQNNSPKLRIVQNNDNFLDKDETMEQVVKEIEIYKSKYNIPPIKITSNQWDIYFNNMYQFFKEKGIEKKFYLSMSLVTDFTLANSLINEKRKITIYDFVDNLDYLKSDEITKKDILNSQKDILNKLPVSEGKIVDIPSYTTSGKQK